MSLSHTAKAFQCVMLINRDETVSLSRYVCERGRSSQRAHFSFTHLTKCFVPWQQALLSSSIASCKLVKFQAGVLPAYENIPRDRSRQEGVGTATYARSPEAGGKHILHPLPALGRERSPIATLRHLGHTDIELTWVAPLQSNTHKHTHTNALFPGCMTSRVGSEVEAVQMHLRSIKPGGMAGRQGNILWNAVRYVIKKRMSKFNLDPGLGCAHCVLALADPKATPPGDQISA